MNTNNNSYIIIYSAALVIVVAFLLAFIFQALKPMQDVNVALDKKKQILAALNIRDLGDNESADMYKKVVKADMIVDANANVIDAGEQGGENAAFKLNSADYKAGKLAVYECEVDGKKKYVIPVYGMGLWGPIWGYIAFEEDLTTIASAYFDHDSETAGLGARIKDDPDFQHEFNGEKADFALTRIFEIVKGGAPKEADGKTSVIDNKIDAITGATMTCKGLDEAINTWLGAYKAYFGKNASTSSCCGESAQDCGKCTEGCDEAENNCGEE